MKQLKQRLITVKAILKHIEHRPAQWTPLVQKTMLTSTPWRALSTLRWLKDEGYVLRVARGRYAITELGRHLLKALN